MIIFVSVRTFFVKIAGIIS